MVRVRGKVKVAYIENNTRRRETYRTRQKGLLKKAKELSRLCGCEVANVRYSRYHKEPMVYPSYEAA